MRFSKLCTEMSDRNVFQRETFYFEFISEPVLYYFYLSTEVESALLFLPESSICSFLAYFPKVSCTYNKENVFNVKTNLAKGHRRNKSSWTVLPWRVCRFAYLCVCVCARSTLPVWKRGHGWQGYLEKETRGTSSPWSGHKAAGGGVWEGQDSG